MWLGGTTYPSKTLYDAWDLLLGSQMHDMLPGTSVPKAYEYCWSDELLAANQFAAVETDAVGAIARHMNTGGNSSGASLVIYNPLGVERDDLVECDVDGTAPEGNSRLIATGPDNRAVPVQVLSSDNGRLHVVFS